MTWTTPAPTEIPYAEDGDARALWPDTSRAIAERLHELMTPIHATGFVLGTTPAAATPTDIPWGTGFAGDPFGMVGDTIVYNGDTRMYLITLQVHVGGAGVPVRSSAGIGTAPGVYDRTSTLGTGPGAGGTTEHTHHVTMLTLMGPGNVTTLTAGVWADPGSLAYEARIDIVGI